MKTSHCLHDQDLTLLYYGELVAESEQQRHLDVCTACRARMVQLKQELDGLPAFAADPGPAAGTRMAARVAEQLSRPRRNWLPALGTSVATLVLLIGFFAWTPSPEPRQPVQVSMQVGSTINPDEDMPDINFLEDLDLLQQLELLSQIEGV